jgi:tetratricopeptide (TPR) repeat protein
MNRLFIGVTTAVLLLVSATTFAWGFSAAQGGSPVRVAGKVYADGGHSAINHATVRLCDGGGNTLAQEVTSDSGEFRFLGLQRGSYSIAVEAAGFRSQSVDVDLNFASDRSVDIYLSPVEGRPPRAPAGGSSVSAHEMSIPQDVRDLVAAGKKKIWLDKNVEGGLADLRRAIASAPGYYEAYYEIGLAYLMMGKSADARQNFRESLVMSNGTFGDAEVGFGAALVNEGDVVNGEKALRRGILTSPNCWLGYYELGKIELSQNHLADAEKLAEQVRSLAPNFPSIYRLLANIHSQQKNYPAMLQDIDAYLQLDPNSAAAVRAKEIRDEIRKKMTTEVATAPTGAAPH